VTGRGAALLLLACGCVAHLQRDGEPTEFLEPTTVGALNHQGDYFEIDGAAHLLILDTLGRPELWREGGSAASLTLSFIGMLRVFDLPSAPVRTPTYEPKLRLQLFRVAPLPAPAGEAPPFRIVAVELGIGHRSNGAEGCALADHGPPGRNDFDCPALTTPPSSALNLKDGSFTTNYLEAGLWARFLRPLEGGGPLASAATAGFWGEWHPPGPPPFMPAEMRTRYGSVVLHGQLLGELAVLRGRHWNLPVVGPVSIESVARVTLAGQLHADPAGGPFGGGSAELALLPRGPRGYGLGLFVRRLFGRDPLNIRFEQQLDAWMVGLIFDPNPIERIPAPAGAAPSPGGEP